MMMSPLVDQLGELLDGCPVIPAGIITQAARGAVSFGDEVREFARRSRRRIERLVIESADWCRTPRTRARHA